MWFTFKLNLIERKGFHWTKVVIQSLSFNGLISGCPREITAAFWECLFSKVQLTRNPKKIATAKNYIIKNCIKNLLEHCLFAINDLHTLVDFCWKNI